MSAIATLRAWELIEQGKGTLYPDPPADLMAKIGFPLDSYAFEGRDWHEIQGIFGKISKQEYHQLKGKTLIEKQFHALRKEAEDWNQARSAYLLLRLQTGAHPDTDADFWHDFQDPPMPLLAKAKKDPRLNLLGEFDGEDVASTPPAASRH